MLSQGGGSGVKMLVARPVMWQLHMTEGKNQLLWLFSDLHLCAMAHAYERGQTGRHIHTAMNILSYNSYVPIELLSLLYKSTSIFILPLLEILRMPQVFGSTD